MKMRRKTVRRVGILLAAAALLGGGGVAVTYKQQRQRERQIDADRKTGMAAYFAGDFAAAVGPLERVIDGRPADDKAVLAFAVARARTANRTNGQVRQAIQKLTGLLEQDPHNLAAKEALLEIYPQTGNDEALEKLSADVLAEHPGNEPALRGRINVLIRREQLDAALAVALQYAQLKPDNFQAQTLVLHLMARLSKPAAEAVAFSQTHLDRAPDDARALLLMAVASNYARDQDKALSYLQQSANRPIEDPDFVRQLAGLFDLLKRPADAERVLEQAAERTGNVDILRGLVLRLWQNGRDGEIVDRLAKVDVQRGDAELVAMRAMAFYQLHQNDRARLIVKALKDRSASPKATAWATALEARFEEFAEPASAVVTKLTSVLPSDPNNGIFSSWIADAYWELGEAGLALRHWRAASVAMPGWPKPYLGMSQAQLRLGRTAEAAEAAEAACERMPTLSAAVNRVLVRYKLVEETGDVRDAAKLLGMVEEIRRRAPNEPRTLPIYVSLLARTGDRAAASAEIDKAVVAEPCPGADTLLALAAVSRAEGLDREAKLVSRTPKAGLTPRLALARAMTSESKAGSGLVLLKEIAAKAPKDQAPAWECVIAEYLDAANDPTSPAAWTTLGTRHAGSLDVQRTILTSARSVRSDRGFIEQTINRLRSITGEDGHQWKIERAKWLIESPDILRDCREAVLILKEIADQSPGLIEPRLHLAKAHERMGNVVAATEHLRAAQAIDARSADVMFELVRLLQQQGQTGQVRDLLGQLSGTAMMTSRQRVMLASMFADAGDAPRAISMLEGEIGRQALPASGQLLLAELYRRGGDDAKAAPVYEELLKAPNPSPAVRASAAEFFATTGRIDRARSVLADLARGNATPLEIALATARFEERFGDPAAALGQYRRAADVGGEAGRLALIDYLLRTQDVTQAVSVATQAVAALPASTAAANRLAEAKALARLKSDPSNFAPLIAALSKDPARNAEVEMYKLLDTVRRAGAWDATAVSRLTSLAERFPRFGPLQEMAVDQLLRGRRISDAVAVAHRAASAMPVDPAAGQLPVRALRAAGRWPEMQTAAEQWKRRVGGNTLSADVAIAEALLNQNKPDRAIASLEPHRDRIAGDVRTEPAAAAVLARALHAAGEGATARQMIQPLLGTAAGRRLCLGVAESAGTADDVRLWLGPIDAAAGEDEKPAVAAAWVSAARRLGDLKLLEESLALLQPLAARKSPPAETELLRGGVLMQLDRPADAEAALRNAMADAAVGPAAHNDLATLLLARDPAAAEPLARVAVEKQPLAAAFHDTLARVLQAKGDTAGAVAAFDRALKLDPGLAEARLGKAKLLRDGGDNGAARRELNLVEAQLRGDTNVARRVGGEYSTLRAELDASAH
jgi:tetratricopeptide (TPR) repeat protein